MRLIPDEGVRTLINNVVDKYFEMIRLAKNLKRIFTSALSFA